MADWDYEFFWKETLNQMYEELGEQEFSRWFTLLEYRGATENTIILGVPSNFYREEIKRRYKTRIEEKLKLIIEKDMTLVFEIVQQPKKTTVQSEQTKLASQETESSGEFKEKVEKQEVDVSHQEKNTDAPMVPPAPRAQKRHPQLKPDYSFDAYVIGDNNSFAANAALAIAKNPGVTYNPFFLYGGVGLGKTHLLQAIGNYVYAHTPDTKIVYINTEAFLNEYVDALKEKNMSSFKKRYRYVDVLLMDDVHFVQEKEGLQEELFHTFNTLYESNKQIVFTCDRPATELKKISDRLRSRFERGLNIDLQPPNYETRYAILKKKAESKNVAIPDEVIALISKNVSSNVRDLEAALTTLVAYADLVGKTITVEIARQQLKDVFAAPKQTNMSIDVIQRVVAEHFKITPNDLKGKKKSQNVVFPRQLAIYISREITEFSTTEIGQAFGGRDHTTAMHSCNKIRERIQADPTLDSTIQSLIRMIKEYNAKA
ncbi:MAG: chromosomal replication initiator protein DnaA [Treponema sp.]|jgi:chromosomal replication initiator protein|nr:chromosomal replication initiator protein DnaA [Treponema sp.]